MKKNVIIEFNENWVFEHRMDNVLPVEKTLEILKSQFSTGINVNNSGFTDLSVTIDSDDSGLDQFIINLLVSQLGLENNDIIKVCVTDVAEESPQPVSDKPETTEASQEQESASAGSQSTSMKDIFAKKASSDNSADAATLLKQIDELVGCSDFKALINEINMIVPQIKQNNTFRSFLFQNYLFSINDGYGLTTYLNLFADLIGALGLFEFKSKEKIMEIKVSSADKLGGIKTALDEALEKINGFGSGGKLVCFDISEQMSNMDSPYFKSFLKSLEDLEDKYIFVFRTPFVENDILDNVCNNIGDVLYVRSVSFVPFNLEELHLCAKRGIDSYGFTMDESAWQVFDAKISEEKSDGRFYGINTVNKIVNEMIYKKQLDNAVKNENNMLICSDDIMSMSKSFGNVLKTGEEMMQDLVGMESVKEQIYEIVTQISHAVKNKDIASPCIHMRFVGNPGTGKTTVARIIGKILCENGVLRNGHFFEYSGRDFCGTYVGETAPKTASICRDAYGSVLFIDEAYSLYTGDNSRDYGREALTTLIAEMENHRSDLVVIMAGYKDDMEILMQGNAGLASRMPFVIDFPNFTREELYNIFEHMVKSEFEYEEDILTTAKEYFDSISDDIITAKEFSNARFVRNIYERTWGKAAVRVKFDKSSDIVLKSEDLKGAINDCDADAFNEKKKRSIGF